VVNYFDKGGCVLNPIRLLFTLLILTAIIQHGEVSLAESSTNQYSNKRIIVKEIKYNHNSLKIEQLIKKVDFNLLIPDELPLNDYTLDVKTYPELENDCFTQVRLHYMDKNDDELLIGIGQKKISDTQQDPPFQEAESVIINGNKGYYKNFANAPGGILAWKQDGTFVEMESNTLSKIEMIKIANSMKVSK
jgi:hypothetical protein